MYSITESTKQGDWTRGDLHGTWKLSEHDIHALCTHDTLDASEWYHGISPDEIMAKFFYTEPPMSFPMLSPDSIKYNLSHRRKCADKMDMMEWDEALLNAFHNFQFSCYINEIVPEFGKKIPIREGSRLEYKTGLLGQDFFILNMVLETASEVMKKPALKMKNGCELSIGKFGDNMVGLCLFVDGYTFHLTVDFNPWYNLDGKKFGCSYDVILEATTLDNRHSYSLYGGNRPATPMLEPCKALKREVKKKLRGFAKKLENAPFNNPELIPDTIQ